MKFSNTFVACISNKISILALALPLLLAIISYDLDVGMFIVVPEVPRPLLVFFEFLFLHSVFISSFCSKSLI